MLASKERKKNADQEGNYKTYHEYSRALNVVPPHAILALARGEREKILSLKAHILKSAIYLTKPNVETSCSYQKKAYNIKTICEPIVADISLTSIRESYAIKQEKTANQ